MFRSFARRTVLVKSRTAVTATAVKPAKSTPIFTTSEEGFQLASMAQPALCTGPVRVAIVFNAGSRYELDSKDRGITHLIRRACGLSTSDYTALNLTRHFQQMGARVNCATTREHMIYTVDVAPNLASRAGFLLAEMATGSVYYHWELKSIVNKLMRQDVELLNRRNLPALAMELLHQAAFGQNPAGSGLGNSVIASADRVGSYSLEQIEGFHRHFFTPANCTVAIVGHDPNDDGLELLRAMKSGLHVRAPHTLAEKTGKIHGFAGGDIRRDLAAATSVHANLAWPTPGANSAQQLAFDVAACLLSGAIGRVSFGGDVTQTLLNTGAQEDCTTKVAAFHKAYNGHGLFGVSLCGLTAEDVQERLVRILPSLRTAKVTEEELKRAKAICKANILMELEGTANLGIDLAIQISEPKHAYQTPDERAAAVDKVTVAQVNEALKQAVNSSLAALSVVGVDANRILPLSVLLSA